MRKKKALDWACPITPIKKSKPVINIEQMKKEEERREEKKKDLKKEEKKNEGLEETKRERENRPRLDRNCKPSSALNYRTPKHHGLDPF